MKAVGRTFVIQLAFICIISSTGRNPWHKYFNTLKDWTESYPLIMTPNYKPTYQAKAPTRNSGTKYLLCAGAEIFNAKKTVGFPDVAQGYLTLLLVDCVALVLVGGGADLLVGRLAAALANWTALWLGDGVRHCPARLGGHWAALRPRPG